MESQYITLSRHCLTQCGLRFNLQITMKWDVGANLKWQLELYDLPMQAWNQIAVHYLWSRQCLTQTTMSMHKNDYVVLDSIYNSLHIKWDFGANLKWQLHYMTSLRPYEAWNQIALHNLWSRQCLTQTTMSMHRNDYVVLI